MTQRQIYDYCIAKPHAWADMPFGDESLLIKVCSHYFAILFTLKGNECLSVKCTPVSGAMWRERYPTCVSRGWHCPPRQQPYNNTVDLSGEVPDELVLQMIDDSYDLVCAKLTRKERQSLIGE